MKLANHALTTATDAICDLLNGGHLRMFNAAGVLLAEMKFASKAFKPAIDGLAQSYPLTSETNAPASGCATVFHACDPSGLPIFTGTIGESDDCDMVMDSPHIAAGATVQVDSITFSFPENGGE
jgi:hypothetical protein